MQLTIEIPEADVKIAEAAGMRFTTTYRRLRRDDKYVNAAGVFTWSHNHESSVSFLILEPIPKPTKAELLQRLLAALETYSTEVIGRGDRETAGNMLVVAYDAYLVAPDESPAEPEPPDQRNQCCECDQEAVGVDCDGTPYCAEHYRSRHSKPVKRTGPYVGQKVNFFCSGRSDGEIIYVSHHDNKKVTVKHLPTGCEYPQISYIRHGEPSSYSQPFCTPVEE